MTSISHQISNSQQKEYQRVLVIACSSLCTRDVKKIHTCGYLWI